jgi:outer membrane receptor protein involved in Fe transport
MRIACAILLGLVAIAGAHAGTTGKIAGKVLDSQAGEPLVGANVMLVGTTLGASSDVEGEYFILNIPPGTYAVKASAVGFSPVTVEAIRVTADQTTRVPFSLTGETVEMEDVVVTATRPMVQKDLTSTTASVTGDELEALPLEDVSAVVNLQAGVINGHFRGGRSYEVKYLIDGVSVNDVFSGGYTMQAEVNSIAEIQVLSGTFNAEYGEAMSGVVNQITRMAGESYTGEVSGYYGGYMTDRTELFAYDTTSEFLGFLPDMYSNVANIQASLSGPIPGTDGFLKFFASGRYLNDEGFIYGERRFNPPDSSNFSANDSAQWYIGSTGDGATVPMNNAKRWTAQGKLQIGVGSGKGITLNGLYQTNDYRIYNHAFRLNPDGDYQRHLESYLLSGSYTHVFDAATYLDATGSGFVSDYRQYVYEDPYDLRYVRPERMQDAGANAFLTGGTENWHFYHTTTTWTGRLDATSQVTTVHQLKAGVEAMFHTLDYEDFQVHVDETSGYTPQVPPAGAFDHNVYNNRPYQLSAYVQDKVELDYLVVNMGARLDYFQPDGMYLLYPDSIAQLDQLQPPYSGPLFAAADVKVQVSPRIGISYPITDRGAVHVSYGHFFQIPPFEFLYKNPSFRIPLTGNYPEFIGNTIGNADLEPQRTTMLEIGLQQELTPTIGITLTGYYKDIRNLLGIEVHIKNDFKKYGMYVNRDYGAVRGITLSVEKRLSDGFGGTVDYTYQVAKGDASNPNDDFNNAQASPPIEGNKVLVPLDWDRRHALNATVMAGTPDDFMFSAIARYGTGLPYTPSLQNQRTGLENSDNRPTYFNMDLYLTKYFHAGDLSLSAFLKVYNLFDTESELEVYGDTGRAGYTLDLTRTQQKPRGVNTLPQYYARPDFYSAPRQVVVGMSVGF